MQKKQFFIREISYVGDYSLQFLLENGTTKILDFTSELWGDVFEPLKDKKMFQRVKLSPEIGTISWPTGADIAPEQLKKWLLV